MAGGDCAEEKSFLASAKKYMIYSNLMVWNYYYRVGIVIIIEIKECIEEVKYECYVKL